MTDFETQFDRYMNSMVNDLIDFCCKNNIQSIIIGNFVQGKE